MTIDTTTPALEVSNAVLELGDGESRVRALDDVSLRVAPGRFVAIVGPSGSGKSSLLAVAGALGRPDSGTVKVHGTDLGSLSRRARARFRLQNIGFVFQSGTSCPPSPPPTSSGSSVASRATARWTRRRCSPRSTWRTAPGTVRVSSPVASVSASASPARW